MRRSSCVNDSFQPEEEDDRLAAPPDDSVVVGIFKERWAKHTCAREQMSKTYAHTHTREAESERLALLSTYDTRMMTMMMPMTMGRRRR